MRWEVGVGTGMEKVQSIVGSEKKRTNIMYVYYALDRILLTFMHNSYVVSTNV